MRPPNPYADLRALIDSTRQLDPEEVAELQLEQGYADRALGIYEVLVAQHPANPHYRRRRDWLARLATVRQRPVRSVAAGDRVVEEEPEERSEGEASGTRRIVPRGAPRPPGVDVTLRGMAPPVRARVQTRRGPQGTTAPHASPSTAPAAAAVRRLSIIGVGG